MSFDYTDHEEMEEATLIRWDQYILFNTEELIIAIENFHDGNKLGEGGFGPVYKVTRLNFFSSSLMVYKILNYNSR